MQSTEQEKNRRARFTISAVLNQVRLCAMTVHHDIDQLRVPHTPPYSEISPYTCDRIDLNIA